MRRPRSNKTSIFLKGLTLIAAVFSVIFLVEDSTAARTTCQISLKEHHGAYSSFCDLKNILIPTQSSSFLLLGSAQLWLLVHSKALQLVIEGSVSCMPSSSPEGKASPVEEQHHSWKSPTPTHSSSFTSGSVHFGVLAAGLKGSYFYKQITLQLKGTRQYKCGCKKSIPPQFGRISKDVENQHCPLIYHSFKSLLIPGVLPHR